MVENQDERESQDDEGGKEDFAPTPFEHPLFFPAVMLAFLLWFGYDGWLNPEYQEGGDKHESLGFSRWGAGAILVAFAYFTYRGLQVMREDRERVDPRD